MKNNEKFTKGSEKVHSPPPEWLLHHCPYRHLRSLR
ncbi:hypothetical protein IX296_002233 [Bacteroides pyogenes]|nr:hypothetical protein [Bacteroides pyogenes]MBR8739220.1 hypothetical protein [Bacteroides pyogenes]MBR8755099.1 hypothetical protein [Bacteroides pyogenes]MBR8796409.1 hypothetical protein [Bacteroides pyogenes]MBR8809934.1 hypothetical protein [Bacteroides pyogenes]